jgi:hypothetical protein
MKALEEMVFIGEIALQIKIAQLAAERLLYNPDNFDHIEIWCSIQSILVSAGNVKKILWPPYKKFASRGEHLRSLLNIDKNNLLSNREFRNHFEHYDERISDWFSENRSSVYTDTALDPFRSMWEGTPSTSHRAYNYLTQTLTFRGEAIDLSAVMNELEQILLKCSSFVLV